MDKTIFTSEFTVVNIGAKVFQDDLLDAGYSVVNKIWKPPFEGNKKILKALAELSDDNEGLGKKIREANALAFNKMTESVPILKGLKLASDVLDNMSQETVLHAGPPISWDSMCGAMKGSVIGGLIYEGFAEDPDQARRVAGSGRIEYAPCHSKDAVGPMAGVLTANMPVMIVENDVHGTTGYATMNEGWGKTLRFGSYTSEVINRLRWMRDVLAPILNDAISEAGGINIKNMISRALHMGDECHNRDIAATSIFFKEITPFIIKTCKDEQKREEVFTFLSQHEHFFLNICMAACKASLLAGHNVPNSTMVTAMARNGVEVGILMSGTGKEWFTGKATVPNGLYFPGYSEVDAGEDLGDSAITETAGLGAFAMGGAPAIVRFVGGTPEDAIKYTKQMEKITLGNHPQFTIPTMDFRGVPCGIDVRLVVETGIVPVINTGIAHKEPGHGLVGAGVVSAPAEAFSRALEFAYKEWV